MPDLADEIFGDTREAAAAILNGGSESTPAPTTPAATEGTADTQDVDPSEGQGDGQQPAASGEHVDKTTEQKTEEQQDGEDGKKKVDGAAKVREWGEGWERTAKDHEKTINELYKPLADTVTEKFGGTEGLNFAAEIFGAITAEDFDPANALEFLEENLPNVATSIVEHIAKQVIGRAEEGAIKRAFGRDISKDEITEITQWLASGKTSERGKFDALFKGDDLPEELMTDGEGNPLPPNVVDFMRKQAQSIRAAEDKFNSLERRIDSSEEESRTQVTARAIESYVTEQFSPIDAKVAELGLDKALDGETPEIAALRTELGEMVEALAMYYAGKDQTFQAMYNKALGSVAKHSHNSKDRKSQIESVDFSRRIKAQVSTFADKAAKRISPLLSSFAETRKGQVETATKTKPAINAAGAKTTTAPQGQRQSDFDPNYDPFDKKQIHAEVSDFQRARGR